jgi:hypothetical protein
MSLGVEIRAAQRRLALRALQGQPLRCKALRHYIGLTSYSHPYHVPRVILYAITGCIAGLFAVVIVTGVGSSPVRGIDKGANLKNA